MNPGAARDAYVLDAWRTPFCKAGGALARLSPQDLAVQALRPLALRLPALAGDDGGIDDVLLGNVLNGRGNLARYAALGAGLPDHVPGATIDRQCASGLESVAQAFHRVRSGEPGRAFVCGGIESMSQAPFLMARTARAFDRKPPEFLDVPLAPPRSGDPSMIRTAEWIAAHYGISRAAADAFAAASHRRAVQAQRDGLFEGEIVAVQAPDPADAAGRAGAMATVAADQGPRAASGDDGGAAMHAAHAALAALRPVLEGGCVTAGNASSLADGAAVLVVAGEAAAARCGVRPLARIAGVECVGVAPLQMGMGPVPAVRRLLARCGVDAARIDLWEINEAFAAQVLGVAGELKLDTQSINREGGAIALGHPLGASGARIAGHLARRLAASAPARYGVAALCVGGGMGMALLMERAT